MDNIIEGSQAAEAGIQKGDILLAYNEWEYFGYEDVIAAWDDLGQVVQQSLEGKKVLVVGRAKGGMDLDFYEYHLGPGTIGIHMQNESFAADVVKYAQEEYEAWKEEKDW